MGTPSEPNRVTIEFPGATPDEASIIARECMLAIQRAGGDPADMKIVRSDRGAMDLGSLIVVGGALAWAFIEGVAKGAGQETGHEVVKTVVRVLEDISKSYRLRVLLKCGDVERCIGTPAPLAGGWHGKGGFGTLGVVILGASEFPHMEDVTLNNPVFARSAALAKKLFSPATTAFPTVEILDLFNSDLKQEDVLDRIERHLLAYSNMRDVLIYYCGHGAFHEHDKSFYLLLRTTRADRAMATGFAIRTLRSDLEPLLINRRVYFVIDSCFSGAVVESLQSPALSSMVKEQLDIDMPRRGWCALAASAKNKTAMAPTGEEYTMFTAALAHVIDRGTHDTREHFNFHDLAEGARSYLTERWHRRAVLPQCSSPMQDDGDVASLDFFVNRRFQARAPLRRGERMHGVETHNAPLSPNGDPGAATNAQRRWPRPLFHFYSSLYKIGSVFPRAEGDILVPIDIIFYSVVVLVVIAAGSVLIPIAIATGTAAYKLGAGVFGGIISGIGGPLLIAYAGLTLGRVLLQSAGIRLGCLVLLCIIAGFGLAEIAQFGGASPVWQLAVGIFGFIASSFTVLTRQRNLIPHPDTIPLSAEPIAAGLLLLVAVLLVALNAILGGGPAPNPSVQAGAGVTKVEKPDVTKPAVTKPDEGPLAPTPRQALHQPVVTRDRLGYGSIKPLPPESEHVLKPKDTFRECADCPEMVVVPAGSFTMGAPAGDADRKDDEGPQHVVTFEKPFALGKLHVTVDQYTAFVRETGYYATTGCNNGKGNGSWHDPGFAQDGTHPVICLKWDDAKAYVDWMSRKTGKPYRLLTESEFEYAARGRTAPGLYSRFWFGDNEREICRYGNGNDQTAQSYFAHNPTPGFYLGRAAPCNDGYAFTSPAGHFQPNAFGLYDMAGNVSQWTDDCYRSYDPDKPWYGGCYHVLRGGAFFSSPSQLRVTVRDRAVSANVATTVTGFRVARTLAP